jgi:endonuclease YncB( thermonuclease family)
MAELTACAPAARVADGDTIIVGRTHYRLWGIEAPDLHQTCAEGWPAGLEARRTLQALVGERRVVCEYRGSDAYRRTVALCRSNGVDLGAAMVSAGMAWAAPRQSRDYLQVEEDAREEGRGVHAYNCLPTPEWRTQQE